jgi:hypothetical protein
VLFSFFRTVVDEELKFEERLLCNAGSQERANGANIPCFPDKSVE